MRKFLVIKSVIFLFLGGCSILIWCRYTSLHVFKLAINPKDNLIVSVLRQRNWAYPVKDGVDVWVMVSDKDRNRLLRRKIDTCDRWQDVEVQYHDVLFNDGQILIGPEYWDGEKLSYYKFINPTIKD